MLTTFSTKKYKWEHYGHKWFSAQVFAQKYFPFWKMDKKNVQKRKPKILFGKKPWISILSWILTENISTDILIIIFLW